MANKEKELNAIFDTFKEDNKKDSADAIATSSSDGMSSSSDIGLFSDTYNALLNIMNMEISGLKLSVWLMFLVLSLIMSWVVWRIANKVKEHNDKELFEKAKNYIHKAGDLERRTLPFALFAILIMLLFVEASGFSYVFSELMINDASEAILQKAMIFGGFVVSIVLMFLTHFSGEELHKMSVLKAVDNEMASLDKETLLSDKNTYPKNKISLEHTYLDDKAKTVVIPQFNRMHQKFFDWRNIKTIRRYYIAIFTFILILSIGVGAMFVRFYVFEKDVDYYQTSIVQKNTSFDVKTELYEEQSKGKIGAKKEEANVPSYFSKQAELRDKYQRSSKIEAEKKASYVTYIVMMMVFFGIQAVGLIIGSRYNFVGEQSKKAYKMMKSYKEKL